MSKHRPQEQGPTWTDLGEAIAHVEQSFACHLVFTTRFHPSGGQARGGAGVLVEACSTSAYRAEVRAMGWHSFRGGAGAATMPAAMLMAVLKLQDKLEGKEKHAAQQHAF